MSHILLSYFYQFVHQKDAVSEGEKERKKEEEEKKKKLIHRLCSYTFLCIYNISFLCFTFYQTSIGDSTSLDIILSRPDDGSLEPKRYRVLGLSFTLNSSTSWINLFFDFLYIVG